MEKDPSFEKDTEKEIPTTVQPNVNTENNPNINKSNDGWDQIGFHRSLAGFWYKLVLEMGIILIPAIIMPLLLRILYPFPESIGYHTAITGLFVLIFQIFDIGTANTISRFVADENIKNPAKMIQYIQYFVWYQAFTGVLQISVISVWALYYAPNTELAYGIWIMLICITKQWPGFPGVFKGVLGSLQQFNKKSAVEFIQSEGIQRLTEIAFVLIGKWYGENNPAIGMILGIAMGAVFGLYLDDIIASVFAAWYLAKALEPYGITFIRLFGVEFDWNLVKQCLLFGIKTGAPGLIYGATQLLKLQLALMFIPQYTTFVALAGMAFSLVAVSQRLVNQDFTPLFTEAYQNNKINLCKYYNTQAIRFLMINTGFAVAIMVIMVSMLESAFIYIQLDRYLLTIPFVLPSLLVRSTRSFDNYSDSLIIAAGKANQIFILKFGEEGLKMLSWYLVLAVFQIQGYGLAGLVFAIVLGDFPVIILKILICYVYIHKKIFEFKLLSWQSFGAPIISTITLYFIFYILRLTIIQPIWDWNFYVGVVVAILGMIILVFGVYFPLTVLLGGWDDNSIRDFKRIQNMVGPSTFIVHPMAKLIFKTVDRSKLHNKFGLEPEFEQLAFQEMEELQQIRDQNRSIEL